MEENILIGYKRQPLKDIIRAKRSNNNTITLEAHKVLDTPIIIKPPYSRHCYN